MASISIEQSARARLATTRHITILDRALPHAPEEVATVFAACRSYRVTSADGTEFAAAYYIRDGAWLPLIDAGDENTAFAAIALHLAKVGVFMPNDLAASDAADRAAASAVLRVFTAPLSIAA